MSKDLRIILAVGSLLSGLTYYLCWRWLQLPLIDISAGSFPSFIFVFAFGLLQPKLPTKLQVPYQAHWLLLALVTEPLFGTATLLDGFAALLGYFSTQLVQKYLPPVSNVRKPSPLSFFLAPLLLVGCYLPNGGPYGPNVDPVYMTYTELRRSVAVEGPRSMNEMGRLVVYQNYLFVNEINKGLHIIDNIDPSSPKAVGFIKIPGNTDVSIRNGFLYADSFIDLVVIDIRDPAQIAEINRKNDLFPWNQYQVVGTDEWFDADESFGVVIGVTRRSNR